MISKVTAVRMTSIRPELVEHERGIADGRPRKNLHCWCGGEVVTWVIFKSPFASWELGVFIKRNETHHCIRILYQRHARDQWLWFKELSLPVLVSRWGCVWANLIAHRRWLWRAAVLESCSRGLQTRSGCPGRGRAESAEYLLLDPRPTLGPAQLASPSPGRNNDHCMQHSPAALQQLHTRHQRLRSIGQLQTAACSAKQLAETAARVCEYDLFAHRPSFLLRHSLKFCKI